MKSGFFKTGDLQGISRKLVTERRALRIHDRSLLYGRRAEPLLGAAFAFRTASLILSELANCVTERRWLAASGVLRRRRAILLFL